MFGMKSKLEDDQTEDLEHEKENCTLQYVCAISISFMVTGCASNIVWTSPTLPYLTSEKSEIRVTVAEGSWITTMFYIGAIFGCLLMPFFINRIGRKYSFLLFALPQVVGWILIIFAKNVNVLYVARFMNGITHGSIYEFSIIYLGEIAEKNLRGRLAAISRVGNGIGMFYVVTVGAYVSYNTLNCISISIPLLFIATFVFMPETPYFYLMHHREQDAVKSLMALRGVKKPELIKREIERMKIAISQCEESRKSSIRELFGNRANRRSLLIMLAVKMTKHLSGNIALKSYTQETVSYSGFSLAPQHSVIVLYALKLIATLVSAAIIERICRRKLLLLSGVLCCIALFAIGLFFFLKFYVYANVQNISWLPLVSFIVYDFAFTIGLSPISYILPGEIFPLNVKGSAFALGKLYDCIIATGVGLGYHALNDAGGIYTTFWVFSASCIIGSIFVFWLAPETKGKTLEEIQVLMDPNKMKRSQFEPLLEVKS